MPTVVCDSVIDMIGNTPLVHLRSLSQATRCTILAKAEFSNPGGSSKDRVAAAMVQEAEASGALAPGGTLVEATSGSTGVSLALVARARGYGCLLVVPDDTSGEKLAMMRALGAEVEVVKPAPIASEDNAVNVARRRAKERPGSVFCDQVHETWLGSWCTGGGDRCEVGAWLCSAPSSKASALAPAQTPTSSRTSPTCARTSAARELRSGGRRAARSMPSSCRQAPRRVGGGLLGYSWDTPPLFAAPQLATPASFGVNRQACPLSALS